MILSRIEDEQRQREENAARLPKDGELQQQDSVAIM
jgi:hypothetical protein